MLVLKRSALTGILHKWNLDVTQKELDDYHDNLGTVQSIFPHLSDAEREYLISGITPSEWENLWKFSPDEEDKKGIE